MVSSRAVMRSIVGLALLPIALGASTAEAEAEPEPDRDVATAARKLSPRTDAAMAAYSATYDGELSTQDLRIKGGVPIVRADGFGVGLLVGYGLTHMGFDTGGGDDGLDLHRFEAILGGGATLAPGRSVRASIGTAHASDLVTSTWSAMQLTSTAMVHWVLGPDDAVMVGALYTSEPDFFSVAPILGYIHERDGARFRFDMFLPKHVRAEYELHPRLRGALGIEAIGSTWMVHRMQGEEKVRRAGGAIFAELGFRFTRRMRLEARVGANVSRYTLPDDASAAMLEESLRPASFAQLALLLAP
jgi:hypothetical protein